MSALCSSALVRVPSGRPLRPGIWHLDDLNLGCSIPAIRDRQQLAHDSQFPEVPSGKRLSISAGGRLNLNRCVRLWSSTRRRCDAVIGTGQGGLSVTTVFLESVAIFDRLSVSQRSSPACPHALSDPKAFYNNGLIHGNPGCCDQSGFDPCAGNPLTRALAMRIVASIGILRK